MIKKVLLLLLTLLTITATILVSCKSDTTTEEEPETPPPPVDSSSEKPQYGGTTNLVLGADLTTFDEAFGSQSSITSQRLTHDELLTGDWAKGPAGTGEIDFMMSSDNTLIHKTGSLADRWEVPTRGKIIFHIREGVRWHNKAPCNGRELTVDDVVFSFKRMCTESGAYIKQTYPTLAKSVVITGDAATRTVTVDTTPCPSDMWVNVGVFHDYVTIVPKDAIEQFGDMNNWKNSIGTGPYMLTDFISGGSVTYERNPNYFLTNPCGPGKGDQLPYMDSVKFLIITDTATAITAFRTMQIDNYSGEYDDLKEFIDNPDIQRRQYISEICYSISMRTDKADSPFSKKEVRQALTLAMDYDKIKNEYYGGRAEILVWPLSPLKEYMSAYVPMEKLPASVQELYSHNVTKAKELLTAAGWPTGFDATVICYNTPTSVDYLSLVQDMWDDIGVRLTIDAKDINTYTARVRAKNYDSMMYFYNSSNWKKLQNFTGTSIYNMSYVNDAYCEQQLLKAFDLIDQDEVALAQMHAELMPYILEQCWVITKPDPYIYAVWWPWVKNYHGEISIGYYNSYHTLKYRWTDVALKNKMTGQ
jgi:peptide/nickel transport system substrate-binding protein